MYLGAVFGAALLVVLAVRVDLPALLQVMGVAGWPLLWLIPYRALYFLPYAIGWGILLDGVRGRNNVGLPYLFWVTTVREGIDRLLPVASVGGGVAGVRLLRWRGLPVSEVSASIIVEIVLTLFAIYLFFVAGVLLLLRHGVDPHTHSSLLLALVIALPVPVVTGWLLRYGSVFERAHGFLLGLVGATPLSEGVASLDRAIRATLQRHRALTAVGLLQLGALVAGSFEVWFALRLFGHPVDWSSALVLESLTQAVRHIAFVIPAGLGVQEAGLVMFGRALGIDAELALGVSMAKRVRELVWGVAALLSWQWMEGRNLHEQWRARRPVAGPARGSHDPAAVPAAVAGTETPAPPAVGKDDAPPGP
jgi:putative membrane protein